MLTAEFARRLFAALWFAIPAAIPVGLVLLFLGMPGWKPMRVMIIAVPILAAGIGGLTLGAGILDGEKVKSVFGAFVRGLAIALLSYLILFIVLFVGFLFTSSNINVFITLFLYGLFSIGWLIAAVGAAAGGLLYPFRLKMMKRLSGSREL